MAEGDGFLMQSPILGRFTFKVVALDGAFLTIPNKLDIKTQWRCSFIGGELAMIRALHPTLSPEADDGQ